LARRVVAECDVEVGVDETRNGGGAIGVDDDVATLNIPGLRGADAFEHRVARDKRGHILPWP